MADPVKGPIKVRALRAGFFALNWAAKDQRQREVAKGQEFLVPEERFVSKIWMERVEEAAKPQGNPPK
jgi:hypothetical protein